MTLTTLYAKQELLVDFERMVRLQVNTNGVISFLVPISQYTPDPFPLGDDRRLLTPFWADVDTTKGGDVWYRETTDQNLLNRVAIDIRRALIKFKRFTPTWLYIVTWDKVAFYGSDKKNNHKVSTVICSILSVPLSCHRINKQEGSFLLTLDQNHTSWI